MNGVSMNQVQMYQHIMANMADDVEVVEFCNKQIDKISNKKANPEVQKYRATVLALIQSNPDKRTWVSQDIVNSLGGSARKAANALKYLSDDGYIKRYMNNKKPYYILQ